MRPATPALTPAARVLGYGGLLPFIGLAVAAGSSVLPPHWRPVAATALAAYGATILSFLGGVHWGVAFTQGRPARVSFAWGVVPSLLGWVALLLPARAGLALLGVAIVACYVVDRRLYGDYGIPRWLVLRRALTVGAAGSCLAAAALL
jgi:hypothetical protein